MLVTVLKNGHDLLWRCQDCPGEGKGVESMADHYRETGHEWVDRLDADLS